jgi:hypothetical protein
MPIDLYFPLLNGGVEQGLNNAGIETFEGEFEQHIVRECTQNALDARATLEGQVRVEIGLRQIAATAIPGLAALRTAIQSSREYWQGNEKTDAFCSKALSWTEGDEIAVLEVADYGTKGLDGRTATGRDVGLASFNPAAFQSTKTMPGVRLGLEKRHHLLVLSPAPYFTRR